jgi:tetratricopeptide (TPR) repeat protein
MEAIASYPEAWPLWHDLGLALAADGRPEDAVHAYRRVCDLGGGAMGAVWVNLGNALRSCGRRTEALSAYRSGIGREPELAAAYYNLHAALYDEPDPEPAIDALRRALELRPNHLDTRFYLGALLKLHHGDDEGLLAGLPPACDFLRTSLDFVIERRGADTRLFADSFATLRHGLGMADVVGQVVELGVRRGTSSRYLADQVGSDVVVHGFDSFQGLPEAWGNHAAGLYAAPGPLPRVPDNVELHVGWFAETLPRFVADHPEPLRFANVDCDLYTSTLEGLEALAPLVVDGSVMVFDEYLCNPDWPGQEHRALREVAEARGWALHYLAFSLFTKQAVVRIEQT